MPAIFVRKSKKCDPIEGIISTPYCRLECDENGNTKLVPSDLVSPSMASDFSVSANVLLQRMSKPLSRISVDAVDLEEQLTKNL